MTFTFWNHATSWFQVTGVGCAATVFRRAATRRFLASGHESPEGAPASWLLHFPQRFHTARRRPIPPESMEVRQQGETRGTRGPRAGLLRASIARLSSSSGTRPLAAGDFPELEALDDAEARSPAIDYTRRDVRNAAGSIEESSTMN